MVVLDTSVVIDHLRQQGKTTKLIQIVEDLPKEKLGISIVSVQELYEGASTLENEKEEYLLATISPLKILPYTYEVAKLAGEIARDLSRSIELADAAIAATAINNNAQFLTLNEKDFQGIKDLEFASC